MHRRPALMLGTALIAVLLAACGTESVEVGASSESPAAGGAAGACLEGATECDDIPETDGQPVEIDETGIAQALRDAEAILGASEDEIGDDIRIARRGDEEHMLTMDLVIGRITAELDDLDGDGTFTVTKTTVELPEGSEEFTLDG